jgi:polysaccharide export outer membrane protein
MKKLLLMSLLLITKLVFADDNPLGPGDMLRITVYGNADLTTETRVTAGGNITFPLVGEVSVAGSNVPSTEKKISKLLEDGGFLKQPQVNVVVLQFSSLQVSVLGDVLRPGRFPLDKPSTLSEMLAQAGGISQFGSDIVSLIAMQDGKNVKTDYDLQSLLRSGGSSDVKVAPGNIVYVHRNQISVLGRVNRPGKYSLSEGSRTILDLLAVAGGISPDGADEIDVTFFDGGVLKKLELNVDEAFKAGDMKNNILLHEGDSIYVGRAPVFYIYGEVQRPGSFRLEKNMTIAQALATGGGLTPKGTERGLKIKRLDQTGKFLTLDADGSQFVKRDDIIYVQESFF